MPFATELAVVYDQLIRPALVGYDVSRADTRLDERGILEKIVTGIHEADLVIADVTDANSNVMYEVGIAHTLAKPTILIAQSINHVPFDIRAYPVHEYSTHFARATDLTRILCELSEAHCVGKVSFANPVTDFIPSIAGAPQTVSPSPSYSFDQLGVDIAHATEGMQSFFVSFETASSRFNDQIEETLPAFKTAPEIAMMETANHIRDLGATITELTAPLRESWDLYGRATAWLSSPPLLLHMPENFRASFARTARSTDATLNSIIADIANLRAANDQLPKTTGNLAHALEATHDALTRLLNELMTGKMHLARAARVFGDETPNEL